MENLNDSVTDSSSDKAQAYWDEFERTGSVQAFLHFHGAAEKESLVEVPSQA